MIKLPLEPFYVWLMVFLRVAFIIYFFPIFGEDFAPMRVRFLLAVTIAVAVSPVVPVTAAMFPTTTRGLIQLVLTEALLGFGIGLIGKMLFAIIQYSGQLAGEQMGFGIVNAIDPTGSHQVSVVSEMLYVLSILVFLTADLHHVFLAAMVDSYKILPPGGATLNAGVCGYLMSLGSLIFEFSLRFAMPVIVIIFTINVSLGMIARGVPQINVFMESFPLRIIAGIAVLMTSLGFTVSLWENMFGHLDGMMAQLIRLMKG
jgi:flagellar biosynthetic protein FliR